MKDSLTSFSMHIHTKLLFTGLIGLLLSGLGQQTFGQTIKAIIVGAVDDPMLQSACQKDVDIMVQNFRQISQGINYPLQRIDLNRDKFTAAAVRAMLDTLTAKPGDVLFFYYTGHGFNTEANQSNYPYLKLKDWEKAPLSLDEVTAKLQGKGARLVISIGDCCNGIIPLTRGLPLALLHKGTSIDQDDVNQVLQKLFVDACGVVKTASAQKKQCANADPVNGSLYTQAFENALKNMLDKNSPASVNWETLLSDTQNRLNVLIKTAETPGAQAIVQSPINDVVIQACTSPGPSPTPAPPSDCVTFDIVNRLVNDLIDNSKSREERQATVKEVSKLFTETAYVKLYVGETPVPPNQSLKSWLNKLYLNSGKNILTINFIEKNSTRTPDCHHFANVAVQEIWK